MSAPGIFHLIFDDNEIHKSDEERRDGIWHVTFACPTLVLMRLRCFRAFAELRLWSTYTPMVHLESIADVPSSYHIVQSHLTHMRV